MKKFHSKHIVPGFSYILVKYPSYIIVVTERKNETDLIVFDQMTMEYRYANVMAVFESIKNGKILQANKEKYRLE